MKAHIIGIPGSGKTTLARWFGETYSIPAYDLDPVVWGSNGMRPLAEIEGTLAAIRGKAGWVTEGAYSERWLEPHLAEAQLIVWLDLPLVPCLWRILLRHIKAELRRDNPHPGWRKLWRFLNYTRQSAARQRRDTSTLLATHADTVVRCRSSAAVARFETSQMANGSVG